MPYEYVVSNKERLQLPEEEFSKADIEKQILGIEETIAQYGKVQRPEKIMCRVPFLKSLETKKLNKCQYCIAASFGSRMTMHPCVNTTVVDLNLHLAQKSRGAKGNWSKPIEEAIEERLLELTVLKDYWQEIGEKKWKNN